jgi:hypothetical protein
VQVLRKLRLCLSDYTRQIHSHGCEDQEKTVDRSPPVSSSIAACQHVMLQKAQSHVVYCELGMQRAIISSLKGCKVTPQLIVVVGLLNISIDVGVVEA